MFYLLSLTWVTFDLLLLQCKYDKGEWCHVYCFPTQQSGKATWVSGQNTRLKFSIFVTFSAHLLNCADRTDDSDGAKLWSKLCDSKLFNEPRCLAELDIWVVRTETYLFSTQTFVRKLKLKKSKLQFWHFQINILGFSFKITCSKVITSFKIEVERNNVTASGTNNITIKGNILLGMEIFLLCFVFKSPKYH